MKTKFIKKKFTKYAKQSLKKEMVDEIYRKSDSIEYDEMTSVDYTLFLIKLNPLPLYFRRHFTEITDCMNLL